MKPHFAVVTVFLLAVGLSACEYERPRWFSSRPCDSDMDCGVARCVTVADGGLSGPSFKYCKAR